MRKNLNRTMSAALLTGGIMVATAGFAQAIPLPINVDDEVRVGNLVSVPVKICGNAINVLGRSDATCGDNAPKAADQRTMADKALVSAPVTVCGNSVSVAGGGNGSCGESKPEPPNGNIEAPVTVCGTSAAVLGTAKGDCGKSEGPGEEPPGEEPPGQNPPGTTPPGQTPPDNGGNPGGGDNGGDNNSGGGNTGDDSGAGVPQTGTKASNLASPIPNLSKTGADPLEFLLVGLGLMTAGVMARRGARRVTKA
ncbi:hypothetical protein [Lentzea nigeriaca]|uniref:hypothetical protein n=1 Tax=Lentzea nigeriaca TaxID=1128665 RepID=UPI001959FBA4|nr:hypothetical protein [Lentzea nigeriaca]MBM7857752.1 hypothetical protein [Lentzea nigeriaca]